MCSAKRRIMRAIHHVSAPPSTNGRSICHVRSSTSPGVRRCACITAIGIWARRIGVHKTLTAVGRELAGFVWALGQALEEVPIAAAAQTGRVVADVVVGAGTVTDK